jgi:hypothetical protein
MMSIWSPVRKFFDLRAQVKMHMARFECLEWHAVSVIDDASGRAKTDQADFDEAQSIFGELSEKLIAFGQSERPAAYLIKCLGIDPVRAGRRLAVLADEIGNRNEDRAANYHAVARLLKF